MSTSLVGCACMAGMRCLHHPSRRCFTGERSLSAATGDPFIPVSQLAQNTPDRGRMCDNSSRYLRRTCQLFEKGLMRSQLSISSRAASGCWFNCASIKQLTFSPDPGRS